MERNYSVIEIAIVLSFGCFGCSDYKLNSSGPCACVNCETYQNALLKLRIKDNRPVYHKCQPHSYRSQYKKNALGGLNDLTCMSYQYAIFHREIVQRENKKGCWRCKEVPLSIYRRVCENDRWGWERRENRYRFSFFPLKLSCPYLKIP